MWKDLPYDSKSDIWSLGCVLYEVVNLKPPFRAKDMSSLYKKVIIGEFADPHKNYTVDLLTLIKSMIRLNPKDRPSCDQILKQAKVQEKIK